MKRFSTIGAALATLIILTGIAVAWGGSRTTMADKNTTSRVVELELTFANGDVARVRQFDSVPFTIDDHGKVLSIVARAGDVNSNSIQLEISQPNNDTRTFAVSGEGVSIGRAGLGSVKFGGIDQSAQGSISSGGHPCCAIDCSGRQICNALCVCTPCGKCGPCLCVPFPTN